MELKEFVKKVLIDVSQALDEADKESSRKMHFNSSKEKSTVEFDVAVTAKKTKEGGGKAGVKVLSFIEGGAIVSQADKSSTVSRVCFGVNISPYRKGSPPKVSSGRIGGISVVD